MTVLPRPEAARIKIRFSQDDGSSMEIEAASDRTLMEAARENDIANLLAECGGCLACGTCHVIVGAGWWDRLPAPDIMELEMIGGLENPCAHSRLSCQVKLDACLNGLAVRVPLDSAR